MTPTYSDGDYILAVKWPKMSTKTGDIVVVDHPKFGVIVKRVEKIVKHSLLSLHGDNPQSVSPESIGLVTKKALIGKVLTAFKQ